MYVCVVCVLCVHCVCVVCVCVVCVCVCCCCVHACACVCIKVQLAENVDDNSQECMMTSLIKLRHHALLQKYDKQWVLTFCRCYTDYFSKGFGVLNGHHAS